MRRFYRELIKAPHAAVSSVYLHYTVPAFVILDANFGCCPLMPKPLTHFEFLSLFQSVCDLQHESVTRKAKICIQPAPDLTAGKLVDACRSAVALVHLSEGGSGHMSCGAISTGEPHQAKLSC